MGDTLKKSWLLLPAFCVDALQWFLQMALTVIGPLGIGGTLAGCYAGSKLLDSCVSGGVIGGLVGAVANTFAEPVTMPIGIALGFVLSFVISIVGGTFLIGLLALNGMYAPGRSALAYMGEIAPGISLLPGWTALVMYCLWKQGAGTKGALLQATESAKMFTLPDTPLGNAVRSGNEKGAWALARFDWRPFPNREEVRRDVQQFRRAPLNTKNFDGVRRPKTS